MWTSQDLALGRPRKNERLLQYLSPPCPTSRARLGWRKCCTRIIQVHTYIHTDFCTHDTVVVSLGFKPKHRTDSQEEILTQNWKLASPYS